MNNQNSKDKGGRQSAVNAVVIPTQFEMCCDFLSKNGFETNGKMDDYISFCKDGSIGIDINEKEIVFIGEAGDFLHLPVNKFALIGALIEYRQLPINYKS